MEFNVKLQELRKSRGLTQEDLANALFVSRTAISKWESGRGYPNIDSLKAIADFFSITIDELLSGDELITIAEETTSKTIKHFCDIVFGLLDLSVAIFLFLPFFREKTELGIHSVSLLQLSQISPYLKTCYFAFAIASILSGVLTFALHIFPFSFGAKLKNNLSLILNIAGVVLFTISLQPYAAVFLFVFMVIKLLIMIKRK